jgi:hypothetical protein
VFVHEVYPPLRHTPRRQACLHRWVPLSALRHLVEHNRDPAHLLQRPQSPGLRRGQHTIALMLSLLLIRRDPLMRVRCHPLHPLSV